MNGKTIGINMKEINLKLATIYVKSEVRTLRPNIKVVFETPDFGITPSCRKQLGIDNPIKYWEWQMEMKRQWENGR